VTEFLALSRGAGHDIVGVHEVDTTGSRLLEQLLVSRAQAARIFVVHLRPVQARLLMQQAEPLNLLSDGHVFIASDAWATPLSFVGATPQDLARMEFVLGVRPHTFSGPARNDLFSEAAARGLTLGNDIYGPFANDCALVLARAISQLIEADPLAEAALVNVSVDAGITRSNASLAVGAKLLAQLQNISTYDPPIAGASGDVLLDSAGDRLGAQYDVVNVQGGQFLTVGQWSSSTNRVTFDGHTRIRWYGQTPTGRPWNEYPDGVSGGVSLRVVSEIYRPFFMPSESIGSFEGLAVDVLHQVAARHGFSYVLHSVDTAFQRTPSGGYTLTNGTGIESATLESALENAILSGTYHIALTGSRISIANVPSSTPYYRAGMSLMLRKSQRVSAEASQRYSQNFWAFARPFTPELWGIIILAFALAAMTLWTLERTSIRIDTIRSITPQEVGADEVLAELAYSRRTRFEISGVDADTGSVLSRWKHLLLALFQSLESTFGTQTVPTDIAARTAMVTFQFFLLICFSAYTANLAAYLSSSTTVAPCRDFTCIAQNDLTVAVPRYPVTDARYLSRTRGITSLRFYDTDVEAVEMVLNGSVHAVFGEEWRLLYQSLQNTTTACQLEVVGSPVNERSLRMYFWPFLAFQDQINEALDQIQGPSETGSQIHELHELWLERSSCKTVSTVMDIEDSDTVPLTIVDLGGLFTLTLCIAVFLIIARGLELYFAHRNHRHKKKKMQAVAFTVARAAMKWKNLALKNKSMTSETRSVSLLETDRKDKPPRRSVSNRVFPILGGVTAIDAALFPKLSPSPAEGTTRATASHSTEPNPVPPAVESLPHGGQISVIIDPFD
jgi:ABC-type amino acid transport substrate-binding protein